ncbi:unnamed protein product [Linum trigynum]|uniref:Uncharacterized protein n=1 Tax=Linum trigynum TaxID=586398 RepID=A0AAV2GE64_9ROSI
MTAANDMPRGRATASKLSPRLPSPRLRRNGATTNSRRRGTPAGPEFLWAELKEEEDEVAEDEDEASSTENNLFFFFFFILVLLFFILIGLSFSSCCGGVGIIGEESAAGRRVLITNPTAD